MCIDNVRPHLQLAKNATGSAINNAPLVPSWLMQDLDLVGIFGNADPADISQWLEISNSMANPSYKAKSRIWNPTYSRCSGLISGLAYRIYWTYTGSVANPQAKIIRYVPIKEIQSSISIFH